MSLYTIPEGINIEATAQRTDIAHFMDVAGVEMGSTTIADDTYQQLGTGFTSLTESPSAQTMGDDFVSGFNAAAEVVMPQIKAAHDIETAAYYSAGANSDNIGSSVADEKKYIIENKLHTSINLDGKTLAEQIEKVTNVLNRGRGK